MKQENNLIRFSTLVFMVLAAALYRILPHPWNFSPVAAISLFGGAYFGSRIASFAVPLITIWISDLVLNNIIYGNLFQEFTLFYDGFYWQYASFILITFIGTLLKDKISVLSVGVASLSSSVLFFIISNFGAWISLSTYPRTPAGLMTCYLAGLPYFQPTLIGDLLFCTVLFGTFELLQKRYVVLKPASSNE